MLALLRTAVGVVSTTIGLFRTASAPDGSQHAGASWTPVPDDSVAASQRPCRGWPNMRPGHDAATGSGAVVRALAAAPSSGYEIAPGQSGAVR